jgi:hypothetical protein
MSKAKPYIPAAFLCERIIEDKEGVLSAIRIVDTFSTPKLPDEMHSDTLRPTAKLTMLLSFKAGEAEALVRGFK